MLPDFGLSAAREEGGRKARQGQRFPEEVITELEGVVVVVVEGGFSLKSAV